MISRQIDIEDSLFQELREQAEHAGRTVEEQIAHWAHLGRVIEASHHFDIRRVQAALEGRLSPGSLTSSEHAAWKDAQ